VLGGLYRGLFFLLRLGRRDRFFALGVFFCSFFPLLGFYLRKQFTVFGDFRCFLFLFGRFFGVFTICRTRLRGFGATCVSTAGDHAGAGHGNQAGQRCSEDSTTFHRSPVHGHRRMTLKLAAGTVELRRQR
jgi:hypothetical protein